MSPTVNSEETLALDDGKNGTSPVESATELTRAAQIKSPPVGAFHIPIAAMVVVAWTELNMTGDVGLTVNEVVSNVHADTPWR